MKRNYALIVIMVLLPQFLLAQTFSDAFRMSYNQIQGTARAAGMGNAFGALGGDFTSLSINPAGSAVYQSSEFVITPNYYINKSDITAGNSKFSDQDQGFALNNVGAVGAFKTNRSEAGIVSINYGIGFNRLADYSSKGFANFDNSSTSYLDDIVNYTTQEYQNNDPLTQSYLGQDIQNIQYRDWPTKLAWDNYLINPAVDNQNNEIDGMYNNVLLPNETVNQRKTFSQSGHLDEYLFNLSLNFNHKFYLGSTIGIHDMIYHNNTTYEELLPENSDFQYYNNYFMQGHGFNLKIGAIYRPIPEVRLGLAFHTPTFYQIDEESTLRMDSYLTWENTPNHKSYGTNIYNYDFNTPLKVVMSGAFVFAKKALVGVDAEYMDYVSMRFNNGGSGSDNFNDLNSVMDTYFKSVLNLRVGAELKLTDQFAIRGGYQSYGNPFKSNDLNQQATLTDNVSVISAGFGYTVNAFAINVAYTNSVSNISDGNEQPNYYQLARQNNSQNVLVTLGFRF
ncbi:MAG TPA: hypothetical protein PK335_11600 [Draconibacterium sp.]|nr:hypothetical protein [Draconibacterium sp.]